MGEISLKLVHSRDEDLHPAIPRVQCPRCGLRLSRGIAEPLENILLIFECSCDFEYRMSAAAYRHALSHGARPPASRLASAANWSESAATDRS